MRVDTEALPEGTGWKDFMTPLPADSPVGKGDVARILQYGVREGGEAGERDVSGIKLIRRMRDIMQFAVRGFDSTKRKPRPVVVVVPDGA